MRGFKSYIYQTEFYCESRKSYDNDIAYLYQQNMPLSSIKSEIDTMYGEISLAEIYRSLRRNGISPSRRERPYKNDVLYYGQCGFGFDEISQLTGYSIRQIRNILKNNDGHISE